MNTTFRRDAGPSRLNNAFMIEHLDEEENSSIKVGREPQRKVATQSALCLVERLPSIAFIEREAKRLAPVSVQKELERQRNLPSIQTEDLEPPTPTSESGYSPKSDDVEPATPTASSPGGTLHKIGLLATVSKVWRGGNGKQAASNKPWSEPQPWEVMKAIERKDVMFLMEVRDRAFHLLLQRVGDSTPLLHAMRIGRTHRDVAIVLVGAMSRYVNNVEDEDMDKPRTKSMLKALRTNLKLAIDSSLQTPNQSDLIASFLQTLVMSEGDRWLLNQVMLVGLALRAAPSKDERKAALRREASEETDGDGERALPVKAAEAAVRKFATRELGRAKGLIAAVDDYIANATADLLMMAAWSLALQRIDGEPIPTYYFARDDRTYKAFCARLLQHRAVIRQKLPRRLRWQMEVMEKTLEGRQDTMRKKVGELQVELDGEEEETV